MAPDLRPGLETMSRILLTAALIVALMAAVKDGRLARGAGLTGKCASVAAPAGHEWTWESCTPGKLEGAPDLSRQGCTRAAANGQTVYWRCEAQLAAAPVG
jgi:hypothetical protein